jgi:hypothetical protein
MATETPTRTASEREPTGVAADEDRRSGYGSVPGSEFPRAIYVTILLAYVWMLLAAWWAFARDTEAGLVLGMATVLLTILIALPAIIAGMASGRAEKTKDESYVVGTATGDLPLSEACVQILLIPIIVAFAATAFGLTYVIFG